MTDMAVKTTRKAQAWPIGIAAFLVLFVLSLIGVAIFASLQPHDLVVRDYYDAGLEFQKQVDSEARAEADGIPFEVTQLAQPHALRLRFADRFLASPLTGTATLYRPSNAGFDRTVALALDSEGRQQLDLAGLPTGLWRVKVRWTQGGVDYYHEASVVVE